MNAPTFITLTYGAGLRLRFNVAHIVRYMPYGKGSSVITTEACAADEDRGVSVTETPEQIDALLGVTEAPANATKASPLKGSDVEWVVNDLSELGVKIGDQFFFLYKGGSLTYDTGKHDDGRPMKWRRVFKREFGECCYPINREDSTKYGSVSLDDSSEWRDLPPAIGPEVA